MAATFSAYGVYWYDKSVNPAIGYGMVGRILDTGSAVVPAPGIRTGLNGDPRVEGFIDGPGNLRVAVTDYVKDSQSPVFIHDPSTGSQVGNTQSWPEDNLYTLVKFNGYLYAIDYDNAKVIELYASAPYAPTGVSYTLPSSFIHTAGYHACGQALIVIGSRLYGLFTITNSDWTDYKNSVLVRFTIAGSGASRISVGANDYSENIAKNAFSLAAYGSKLYIAAIGGHQVAGNYNDDSRLQSIAYGAPDLTTATVTDLMTPNAQTLPYEIRDISFNTSGTAYVLVGSYKPVQNPTDPWEMKGKLMWTTDIANFALANFTVIDDFTAGVLGYYWSAQYTPDNNRLWYTRGNDIRVYSAVNLAQVGNTLTVTPGSLTSTGDLYTDLNDLSYVGPQGNISLRGYRSPLQRSRTAFAQAARALTRGRPELTAEEFGQLMAVHGAP
ncbi:MAG: hypothetical protein LBI62_06400 [Candidatus Accumulibacter sp.]|jgi:hypothetical protein|nr:hypothetical protein [Accumulibacter sp.]